MSFLLGSINLRLSPERIETEQSTMLGHKESAVLSSKEVLDCHDL